MRTTISAALLAASMLFAAARAAADLPPPAGFVEQCTAAKKQAASPGTECYACSSYHGSMDKCPTLLTPSGFTKSCQSRGASAWSEVWCRPAGGPALTPDQQKELVAPTAEDLAAAKPADAPADTKAADSPAGMKPAGANGCGSCVIGSRSPLAPASIAALFGIAAALLLRRRGRS
jgi:hypothetical protein